MQTCGYYSLIGIHKNFNFYILFRHVLPIDAIYELIKEIVDDDGNSSVR